MAGKIAAGVGIGIIAISVILFVLDIISLTSLLLEVLGTVAFITSILTGKKLSAYLHDLHLSREKGTHLGPAMFIYLWMFMFVLFLIIYTAMKIAFGYFVKFIVLPFGGNYVGILYNLLALSGSYLAFSYVHSRKEGFITAWGKMSSKMERTGDQAMAMAKKPVELSAKAMDEMKDEMKRFMP